MAQAKKRKKFFDIEIPLIGKDTSALAYEIKSLNKKIISFDMTKLLRGKSASLSLIIQADENKATAFPRELKILPYFLKRMVRKGTNYVEDSFSTNSKDAQLRLKPFLVTRRKVSRRVRKALRNKCKEEIINYVKSQNYEEVFDDVIRGKMQKHLSLILKKIYPLSFCEIRILKFEKAL